MSKQQRARGVGRVGHVDRAAGQPPEQETVDRAEREFAALGARARARDIVEHPGDLGRREIGIEQQAGALGDQSARGRRASARRKVGAVRRSCQTIALWIGAPVARFQTSVVSRWLVMPSAGDRRGPTPALAERLAGGRQRRAPHVLRVVLDPARAREDLREFLCAIAIGAASGAEHDGARRGGALIDDENLSGHVGPMG